MDVSHEDRLIGRYIFKEYRIKKKLGEGSFGKVYVASNIKTSELYAIKLVSKKQYIFLTFFLIKKYRKKNHMKMVC